jgi:hypothetical protein
VKIANLAEAKQITIEILNAGMEVADHKFGHLELKKGEDRKLTIEVSNIVLRAWLSLENRVAIQELTNTDPLSDDDLFGQGS